MFVITKQTEQKKHRSVKCPQCEYNLDRNTELFVTHNKRHYHQECFNIFQLRKQHREDLIAYICELYRIPVLNGFMLKQIKDYQDDYGYTIKGMELALRYFHETLGNSVGGKGVGIIPYIYDDAKLHHITMSNITRKATEANFDRNEEVIYIKHPTKKIRKNYIDIEGIT